jgi:hypothetical protein
MMSIVAVVSSFLRYSFGVYGYQGRGVARNSILWHRSVVLKELGRMAQARLQGPDDTAKNIFTTAFGPTTYISTLHDD